MDDEPEIKLPLDLLAGVWANDVRAYLTATEFTLDFVRIDPADPIAVCVARIRALR